MEQVLREWVPGLDGGKVTAILPRLPTVQLRQGDLDIRVPVTDRVLLVSKVLVRAVVLTAASGRAPAWGEAMEEALAGVELIMRGEAGNVMRCCSKDNGAVTSYAIKK